jgi:hypothetical protein
MSRIKPSKIILMNGDQQTGPTLNDSHFESLNGSYNHDNPTQAWIIGSKDAQCTFFDDRLFLLDQNALLVWLKRDGTDGNEVKVLLDYDRLGPHNHDDGIYQGENDDVKWILMKVAKSSWVANCLRIGGEFLDIVNSFSGEAAAAGLPTGWVKYTELAGYVVNYLKTTTGTPGRSDNSRVDNVSSVLFGTLEG